MNCERYNRGSRILRGEINWEDGILSGIFVDPNIAGRRWNTGSSIIVRLAKIQYSSLDSFAGRVFELIEQTKSHRLSRN